MFLEVSFNRASLVNQEQQQCNHNLSPTHRIPMNKAWDTYNDESSASISQRQQERQRRSQTIPMPRTHVPRTNSEVQLREDMAAAEWRDLCMFYRVVNGIRERQLSNSSSLGDEGGDNDGVMITTTTTHESVEDIVAHFKSTKDTSPYESVNEASPHTQAYRRQAEQGFLNQPQQEAAGVEPDGDGWSISGYEEMEAPILGIVQESTIPIVEDNEAEDVEDCVFSMEL